MFDVGFPLEHVLDQKQNVHRSKTLLKECDLFGIAKRVTGITSLTLREKWSSLGLRVRLNERDPLLRPYESTFLFFPNWSRKWFCIDHSMLPSRV